MARKQNADAGAPAWIVTYGDMMSLLLCFFILLAALANYDKQDKRLMTAIESIREALGSPGQRGWMADEEIDFKSILMRLELLQTPTRPLNHGFSDDQGLDGRYYRVKQIRDGLEVVIGGPIAFERFSATLEPPATGALEQIAREIRGYRNKVEIRGHATTEPLPAGAAFPDQTALAFARAKTVRDRLVELGVAPERMRIISAGQYEPLVSNTYTEETRAQNRRVEIVVLQSLVTDYEGAPAEPEGGAGATPPGIAPIPAFSPAAPG